MSQIWFLRKSGVDAHFHFRNAKQRVPISHILGIDNTTGNFYG